MMWLSWGAFLSAKNSEISGPKPNGTVKIPRKVFENLGGVALGRILFVLPKNWVEIGAFPNATLTRLATRRTALWVNITIYFS